MVLTQCCGPSMVLNGFADQLLMPYEPMAGPEYLICQTDQLYQKLQYHQTGLRKLVLQFVSDLQSMNPVSKIVTCVLTL